MINNSLTLAYLGDAVYELYIRKFLISKGIVKVDELQKAATKYVSAKGQANYLKKLIDIDFLSDEELKIVYRGRNHKNNHKPRNTDVITYKNATGLEALIGYLHLNNNDDRIREIIDYIIGE